jgi:hypothetical protein
MLTSVSLPIHCLEDTLKQSKLTNLNLIVDRYPMVDLFILIVDRDGDGGRRTVLDNREHDMRAVLGRRGFIAQEAWQEVEVWALAGQALPNSWHWNEIRSERHPKERYFDRFVEGRGLANGPGGGRVELGRDVGRRVTVMEQQIHKTQHRCRSEGLE